MRCTAERVAEKVETDELLAAVLAYPIQRDRDEPGFLASITDMYRRNAARSMMPIRSAVAVMGALRRPRAGGVRYFFSGSKYAEIIRALPPREVCVIGGPKQIPLCFVAGTAYLPFMNAWGVIHSALEGSPDLARPKLHRLVSNMSETMRRVARDDAVLIVENDSLPIQRSIIVAARAAGIGPVLCIQHGVFQSGTKASTLDGWFSDVFLAIDEHQRSLLISKGMAREKVHVFGFHSSPYRPSRPMSPAGQRTVCFLGQPWTKYGDQRGTRYLEIVRRIMAAGQAKGITVAFKPHPWERDSNYLKEFAPVQRGSLQAALEKFDVFVSLTSTALLEAHSAGRLAVQVLDDAFESDDFSEFSGVVTIPSVQLESTFGMALEADRNAGSVEIVAPGERLRQFVEDCVARP